MSIETKNNHFDLKLLHVVPSINEEADGVRNFVVNLNDIQISNNVNSKICTIDERKNFINSTHVIPFPTYHYLKKLAPSKTMRKWFSSEKNFDEKTIIHNHGLWMMPNIYAATAKRKFKIHLISSPHGTLSEWSLSRNKLAKQIFWKTFQYKALSLADCLHATCEEEYEDIRRLGFKQPVCIIPCGVKFATNSSFSSNRTKTVLFFGRIHPKKGIDLLLHAWSKIQSKFVDWDLKISGVGEDDYIEHLIALKSSLNLKRVTFAGPKYGDAKFEQYNNASLYVLPSFNENFGISIAEAMSCALPVITTLGTPWRALTDIRGGWQIRPDVDDLVNCLNLALTLPVNELTEMGLRSQEYVTHNFSWATVENHFQELYSWLLADTPLPASVRLN